MVMNLRDLQYVVLVAELRHFGKAAEAAHVSQPTLSSQIRKLEDELGVVLFERDSRNVVPTAAGLAVVAEAREALARVEGMKDIARAHADPLAGDFRVGVIASLGPYLVPGLLERMRFDAPRMDLTVHEGLTGKLLADVQNRVLDAVIMAREDLPDGLQGEALFMEPFFVAHARQHRLARQADVTMQDIEQGALLLLDEGHCLRDQVLDMCVLESVDSRVRATSLSTLLKLVEMNRGVTLVPALAQGGVGKGVALRPLADGRAGRELWLVYRRNHARKGAADVLAAAVRTVARDAGLPV
jgi:LysR family transcriptional regulator, hydrogen peroxide-inducible genes activator